MSVFVCWGALEKFLKTPVVIMESSHKFLVGPLCELLGDDFVIQWMVIDATMFGSTVRRPRFYAVLFHKLLITEIYCSLDNIIQLFYRMCDVHWTQVA
jgi:hypothetical protein